MKIFVIGHKSPDVDAVTSAIEYKNFLEETNKYPDYEVVATRAGDINKETKYILKEFGIDTPKSIDENIVETEDKFVLVDHNEEVQRHNLVDSENIIEVIDHHKVNIDFSKPININVRPLGSTSTVIYKLYKENNLEPSSEVGKLMLAGILSDTVGLKSSTTTETDKIAAQELATLTKTDIKDLTFNLLKTKSDIEGLEDIEIAKKDFKTYEFGTRKVFLNQVETVEPEKIIAKKDDLVKALDEAKEEEGCGDGFIIVTDILKVNSQIIYSNKNEKTIVEEAFNTKGEDNVAKIGSRISRKKDIAPEIEATIGKMDSA